MQDFGRKIRRKENTWKTYAQMGGQYEKEFQINRIGGHEMYHLVQYRDTWTALVNRVMNVWAP